MEKEEANAEAFQALYTQKNKNPESHFVYKSRFLYRFYTALVLLYAFALDRPHHLYV